MNKTAIFESCLVKLRSIRIFKFSPRPPQHHLTGGPLRVQEEVCRGPGATSRQSQLASLICLQARTSERERGHWAAMWATTSTPTTMQLTIRQNL